MARTWRAALCAAVLLAARPVAAQQLPPPDQARQLLATRPDLVALLRSELASSGLSPDQIRERLQAAGYPADFLDSYLATSGSRDTLSGGLSSGSIADAVRALGVGDSSLPSRVLGGRYPALSTGAADSAFTRTFMARLAELKAESDSGLLLFGMSVFTRPTTQFDPNLAGPVDAGYRIGPGDRLVLIVTGDAERAFTLDVTREGFVVVPGVGEIAVGNLTLAQADDEFYARLRTVYSGLVRGPGATTHFSLTVARLHTNQVYVLGDVAAPGSYRVSSAGTALTALYAAGGPTSEGGMRRIEIRRGGRVVDSLDVYDYLLHGDASRDVRLQSGDVVFVPVHGPRVRVYGEIERPATYELRAGETLGNLLADAGGYTAAADRRRLQIERILPPAERDSSGPARVVLDVDGGASGPPPALPLERGDVVRVFPVSARVGRRVTVLGDVEWPGVVGFTEGMRVADAIRLAGGFKPDAYRGRILVSRLRPADSTRADLRASLGDSTAGGELNLPLVTDDEIRVFSASDLRSPQDVGIAGPVHHPGRYAYHAGMTLRDLILLAGGLDERAAPSEAEIAHVAPAMSGGRLATAQRVPLDSSYLTGSARQRADVPLAPFDNVLVLAEPGWAPPGQVVITGEVRAPGTYTLLSRRDRLSDLIARAGGLTAFADRDGITFVRRADGLGRLGVDLARVLRDPLYRDNLLLEDGDSIDLPRFTGLVSVRGAVNAPRGVPWVAGEDANYYVRAAGGLTDGADLGHSFVTQPDGRVESVRVWRFWPDDIPVPRPGAVVQIAQAGPSNHVDEVARLSVIAQVIGGLVALAALLRHP